jgi:5-methylcytosine-specific restriction endonuclease McrA
VSDRIKLSKKIIDEVKKRFWGRCGYCGRREKLVIDHILPIARGGTSEVDNLMPACRSCNSFKTVFTLEEFRKQLTMQVERARKYSLNFRLAERFSQIIVNERPVVFYFEKGEKEGEKNGN